MILVSVLCCGCKGKPQETINLKEYNSQFALGELKKYNLHTKGNPTTIQTTLPKEFAGPNWGMKNVICEKSGYNLSSHAGEKVFLTSINIAEKYRHEPLKVWIITKKDTCVGAYVTVSENSDLTPGIFSINDIYSEQ